MKNRTIGTGPSLDDYLKDFTSNDPIKTSIYKNTIDDYINLCAEEYYWYRKGLADEKVWICWENGMKSRHKTSYFIQKSIAEELKNNTIYYNEEFLSIFINNKKL